MNKVKTVLAGAILVFALAGCGAGEQTRTLAESAASTTPDIVRVGMPTEISLDEAVGCLFNPITESDVLIAPARLNGDVRIAVVDLTTGQARRLDAAGTRLSLGPVHFVAQVRDIDPSANLRELLVYDLLQGKTLKIAEGRLRRPHVSGSILVWEEYRGDGRNIYGYDLSQGRQFTVAQGQGSRTFPQASGDWVLYLFWDTQEQPAHILRAYHVPTGDDFEIGPLPLSSGDAPLSRFSLGGSRVAWIGVKRNEIHVYDLETRTDEIIFTDEQSYAVLGSLDSAGDLIMWHGGSRGIVGYDLVQRDLFEIPDLPDDIRSSSKSVMISENYDVAHQRG